MSRTWVVNELFKGAVWFSIGCLAWETSRHIQIWWRKKHAKKNDRKHCCPYGNSHVPGSNLYICRNSKIGE
jgi:hypothetical protein